MRKSSSGGQASFAKGRAANTGTRAATARARTQLQARGVGPRVPRPTGGATLAPNGPAGTKGTGRQAHSATVAAMLATPIQRSAAARAARTPRRGR